MDREQFEKVWKRVKNGDAPNAAVADGETLAALIRGEAHFRALCRWLYEHSSGPCRRAAWETMQEESRILRRLQGAYFLLTGNSLRVEERPVAPGGVFTALRQGVKSALAAAQAFRRAGESLKSREAARLCAEMSAGKERQAERLRRVLAQGMK